MARNALVPNKADYLAALGRVATRPMASQDTNTVCVCTCVHCNVNLVNRMTQEPQVVAR